MAIGPPGSFYDANRDMYFNTRSSQAQYEKEMHYRRMEEEYRRAQQNAYHNSPPTQAFNPAPKPDPKDPLSFLNKADSKLLLTGEAK
jgi:hypothetical protein